MADAEAAGYTCTVTSFTTNYSGCFGTQPQSDNSFYILESDPTHDSCYTNFCVMPEEKSYTALICTIAGVLVVGLGATATYCFLSRKKSTSDGENYAKV